MGSKSGLCQKPTIPDRGAQFTANFWKSFQKGLGTRVNLNTAFHPQTDGQAERTIQTLEDMLRAYVIDFKGNWDDRLPLIEFAYNNSHHSSIKMAPYEALYGRRCRSPIGWFKVGEAELLGPIWIGHVAYELELPKELAAVHPVFHVSMLNKFMGDPSLLVPTEIIGVKDSMSYEEIPVAILDRQIHKLRTKEIASVKVL
uniref:Uncharacterized protein LOC104218392 n=1 Tax=Nicotiana sylvestris TaxID=4096 RepID=A0A1U7VLE5_NICSY|nr:PREDICTED: uncharacterized protein LOC104218392 [Nicotiana sylvestris]